MSTTKTFRAVIEDAGGGGAYVTVPFDVEEAFGRKRVKVRATIEAAKREPTRRDRIEKAVALLEQGRKTR